MAEGKVYKRKLQKYHHESKALPSSKRDITQFKVFYVMNHRALIKVTQIEPPSNITYSSYFITSLNVPINATYIDPAAIVLDAMLY